MKKIFSAVLAAATATLCGCTPSDDFSRRLENELNKEAGTVVRFSELADFEWTTVHVYGPYQPLDEINKKHKADLKGEYDFNHVPEGDCLYIFENQGKTVRIASISRYKGGCFEILNPGVYVRQDAVFEVTRMWESKHAQLVRGRSK